ncbi:LOB domain-containing protein 39 [Forsythia ovata]|uniref:LOB domain-containing protein 39 n=1 Tax=Forsythia ovata TaxID=205694 RepID=A0ABD1VIY8_9LAMI
MSCNGCRILRKGCNENCILRQSLQGIQSAQAQANATVFVAKFFGRAGLMSFLSSVPESQRPALFQSLLFEACGRTVNPVNGAVGLLWTGNWLVCQSAVETVLSGGILRPSPVFSGLDQFDERSEANNVDLYGSQDLNERLKRKGLNNMTSDLDLGLQAGFPARMAAGGMVRRRTERRRLASPPSDESETTTLESGLMHHQELHYHNGQESKLLRLFF